MLTKPALGCAARTSTARPPGCAPAAAIRWRSGFFARFVSASAPGLRLGCAEAPVVGDAAPLAWPAARVVCESAPLACGVAPIPGVTVLLVCDAEPSPGTVPPLLGDALACNEPTAGVAEPFARRAAPSAGDAVPPATRGDSFAPRVRITTTRADSAPQPASTGKIHRWS